MGYEQKKPWIKSNQDKTPQVFAAGLIKQPTVHIHSASMMGAHLFLSNVY